MEIMAENSLLIAYFSHPGQNYVNGNIVDLPIGNTEVVAKMLAAITGARLVRIEQAHTYPKDYHELTEIAKKELRAGARPPLKNALPDMAGVAYLFLGYPKFKKVNQFKHILLIAW